MKPHDHVYAALGPDNRQSRSVGADSGGTQSIYSVDPENAVTGPLRRSHDCRHHCPPRRSARGPFPNAARAIAPFELHSIE
jgi:hypothetical protein